MIDKATVAQILDAANILEVVSDFVHLQRRGSNYMGLCPFHNEKTPSFSVSPAKGICHCFSCGKGGSPVNFVMEHEQLSYYEALKYLAKKYHIEIKERELTDAEKAAQTERESMLIINEFAGDYFENNLYNTTDGKEIGMAYFYERGFSDVTIKKFHLGYSLEKSNALYQAAIDKGYNRQYLIDTGLCIDDHRGGGFDRFKGRVMFPVLNVAGKIIAFGGRTLRKDPAKYLNSPESIIYKKSNELYGLYQAKQAIVKKEKCFLVEGYTDVISMHQAGIENVVASSGTSLTSGQIRMIHRFTENVTVLYDGDSAGIKASLRGIDMLLEEGLNIKVLLLPDGDDPDSFARKHNASEFEEYIKEHEEDFISFKMRILLEGIQNDPIKRAAVIGDVVKSISVIPFAITQSIYAKECSERLGIDEQVLLREIQKNVKLIKQREYEQRQKMAFSKSQDNGNEASVEDKKNVPMAVPDSSNEDMALSPKVGNAESINDSILYPYEEDIIRYVAKFGMSEICISVETVAEKLSTLTIIEYVVNELEIDDIRMSNQIFGKILDIAESSVATFYNDFQEYTDKLELEMRKKHDQGIEKLSALGVNSIAEIERGEAELDKLLNEERVKKIIEYRKNYLEKILCSVADDDVRRVSLDLVSEKHRLSKIHTKYGQMRTEFDRLSTLLPESIYNLKSALILCQVKDIQVHLHQVNASTNEAEMLLKRIQELYGLRKELAHYLGDRVVNPR